MAVKDYLRERFFPHLWCPGCGHGIVLNGMLHAIEQLRLVNDAIKAGSVDRARAQLLEAQQSLANIGLRESTLQAAWQRIEDMDQEATKTPD